jgi:DNA-binding response OmpR family regulator
LGKSKEGLPVLKPLKGIARTHSIPVVMTSPKKERDRVEGYKAGGNGYIQKTVDFEQFRSPGKTLAR